jgi:uracil-DNA glycosylase
LSVYATNAVKHFKYRQRGKRRIHQRPSVAEVAACRSWLQAEISLVSPRVILALG